MMSHLRALRRRRRGLGAFAALLALAASAAAPAWSDPGGERRLAPTPVRTIARGETLSPSDFALTPVTGRAPADAILDFVGLAGMEARRDLPPGRLVLARAITPMRVIARNTPVTLVFETGGVLVTADGMALSDAAAGETVRAVNAKSRRVVLGQAAPDGRVLVRP